MQAYLAFHMRNLRLARRTIPRAVTETSAQKLRGWPTMTEKRI